MPKLKRNPADRTLDRPPTLTTREVMFTNHDHHDVAHRAYELYEERGRQPGHELDDWLQAEHQLGVPTCRVDTHGLVPPQVVEPAV